MGQRPCWKWGARRVRHGRGWEQPPSASSKHRRPPHRDGCQAPELQRDAPATRPHPPLQPPSVPRAAPRRGRGPPRLWGSPVGPPYQARIPCNVEMPAFPCGMGVCTEFKSPTLKFMKLLPAAEGCMGCTEG